MSKTWLFFICALCLIASSSLAQRPSLVSPPQPSYLVASELIWPNGLKGPRDTVARKIWLPRGYSAQVFANGFGSRFGGGWLRLLARDSAGTIHTTAMDPGHIYALPDKDRDGVADTLLLARDDIGRSHSIAFYKGALYCAETDSVRKFTDEDGDGYYETEHPCINDLHTGGVFDHTTRTIAIDPRRDKLLVSVGTSCNACRLEDSLRSVVLEYDLDGSGRRIYATGLRNALGLAFEPGTGKLWATNADRNKMGDDLPEEILTTVADGSFHGWPYAYGDRDWVNFSIDSEYSSMLPLTAIDSQKVSEMHVAELFLPAHSTPAGVHFYQGDLYPEEHRTGFVCVKGSSESTKPLGFKIMRFWQDAAMQWKISEFLTGFLLDTSKYDVWSRPVGIAEDVEGNLYFSLSNNIIIRVTFDESKSVDKTPHSAQPLQLELDAKGAAWLRAGELEFPVGHVLLESYSIAGRLEYREYIAAETREGVLRCRLPLHLKGTHAIALSTDRERLTTVVTIP